MTKTVSGRYGAISGFGLSVVKWVLILKVKEHIHCISVSDLVLLTEPVCSHCLSFTLQNAASDEVLFTQSWFWWLLVALGE